MLLTEEQRHAQRYRVRLPLRIVAADGHAVDWVGQTRDIGTNGVRFVILDEMPVGRAIEYVVSLSSYNPAAEIHCAGEIVRCTKHDAGAIGHLYEAAVTMEEHVFIPQPGMRRFASDPESLLASAQSFGKKMPLPADPGEAWRGTENRSPR